MTGLRKENGFLYRMGLIRYETRGSHSVKLVGKKVFPVCRTTAPDASPMDAEPTCPTCKTRDPRF